MPDNFAGDQKVGKWLLVTYENRFREYLLPKVPKKVETYHLTLSTLLWCFLIIVFSFLAKYNIHCLWVVSLSIFMQYITDLLDGAIGRRRNTGLIKWGFYMDHLLDYLFLCSILIGYSLLLPDQFKYALFFILALFGSFMVNSFLSFAATNEFQISYLGIGPTEVRIIFIIVNTLLIFFGPTYMVHSMPYILLASAFGFFVTVYKTQKVMWALDMKTKKEQDA